MSNAIAKKSTATTWLATPEAQQRIGSALAGWMRDDEFIAQFVIACQDPKIAACTEASKFAAAHMCASLQLLPGLNQVALIPRKDECTVMPQWQGYKAIMERHPDVMEVDYDIVFQGDQYRREASGAFYHDYDPFDNRDVKKDFANIRGGYVRIRYCQRSRPDKFHFVTLETVKKARSCAQTKNVWDKFPRPMLIKTLFRDAYARRVVPIDTLVNRKLQILNDASDNALNNNPNRVVVDSEKHIEQARQRYEEGQPALPSHSEDKPEGKSNDPKSDSDVLSCYVVHLDECESKEECRELYAEAMTLDIDDDVKHEMAMALDRRVEELENNDS